MAKNEKDRAYVVFTPEAWDTEKVGAASGLYYTDSFGDADNWRTINNKLDHPIYSYRQTKKGLADERMEDKPKGGGGQPKPIVIPPGFAGSIVVFIIYLGKALEITTLVSAFLALKLSRLLGWDKEDE